MMVYSTVCIQDIHGCGRVGWITQTTPQVPCEDGVIIPTGESGDHRRYGGGISTNISTLAHGAMMLH